MLNNIGKVLEKIYATRLGYLANQGTRLLSNTQIGCRRQRSAVDTCLLLLHHIQHQRATKKKPLVTSTVFLDIKGAFDHVKKPQLFQVLEKLGLPASFIR